MTIHGSFWNDTIVALATPPGAGAIGIIRLSGPSAIIIADTIFKGKSLSAQASHTLHFGHIMNPSTKELVDEVVVSLYHAGKSYTGEATVEISAHGSSYILQTIIGLCIEQGARMATPGEYTQRAFLNGKMDLTQAEAVADLIAADSKNAQQAALNQLRGGFSNDLKVLREQLINFAALIELELDFSEEDVAFADRNAFYQLIEELQQRIQTLLDSFRLGNVIKNGVSVAIIGKPNAGKSTLLNSLLNEERAIVSDIAGTTRDTIEEVLNIKGVLFRLIDTAGIREETTDIIEQIGVGKSLEKMRQAQVVLYLADAITTTVEELQAQLTAMQQEGLNILPVINKTDTLGVMAAQNKFAAINDLEPLYISAKDNAAIELVKEALYSKVIEGEINTEHTIITNARHHAALGKIGESLQAIKDGLDAGLTGDLLTPDIRRSLHFLGEITGVVEVDRDILGTIFGKFCIGK